MEENMDELLNEDLEELKRGLLSEINSVDDDESDRIDIQDENPGVLRKETQAQKIVNNKVLKYLGTVQVTTDFKKPNPRAWLLQSMLNELGYPLTPDGKFGKMTEEQVKKFQADNNGLSVDGLVGPATWTRLIYHGRNKISNSTISFQDYVDAANKLGVEVEVVQAIKDVESNGSGFVFSNHPTILFEGHVFWKQLEKRGIDPNKKNDSDILYKSWTKNHYKGDVAEHVRLEKARQIYRAAAEASASWGLFQIMGSNYKACGCSSVSEFVERMCTSEREQLMLFVEFIKYNKMDQFLKPGNIQWAEFAKRYNGAGYEKNKYHIKLQNAYSYYKMRNKNK